MSDFAATDTASLQFWLARLYAKREMCEATNRRVCDELIVKITFELGRRVQQ